MRFRLIAFASAIVAGALFYFQSMPPKSRITVSDATAAPMGSGSTMFMVSLKMQNDGAAVTLTDAKSPTGATVSLMNPNHAGPLVIPGGGEGLLAMDGAHMMLSVSDGEFDTGTFQSVSLVFDDGSEVLARVLRPDELAGKGMMHHDMSQGVEEIPAPGLTLASPPSVGAAGFEISLNSENFTFVRAADDAQHVPNEGHAHVYLNGLKLGRLYDEEYRIGALTSGDYVLRIALNTHDHRPYLANGAPVEVTFKFQIQ